MRNLQSEGKADCFRFMSVIHEAGSQGKTRAGAGRAGSPKGCLQMSPRHFHFGAAVILGAVAAYAATMDLWFAAFLCVAGAAVALAYWKAARAGIIEDK